MFSGDGSSMDPMFSGMSLQSLLCLNPSLLGEGFPSLGSLTDEPNVIPQSAQKVVLLPKSESQAKRQRLDSSVIPQSNLARQRRQKLSEKTRCLQKLMPWDKKMDQATLLEEAYKYVKFLQAQFRVLHSMPSNTDPFLLPPIQNAAVFGELDKLNRTQLLQVLVNSPVAQTMLYSQGFCVFSLEQLSLLRKLSQRRHQHLPDPKLPSTN
ncbi:Transcription factor bHLH117, partial [Mucuna pruriens]